MQFYKRLAGTYRQACVSVVSLSSSPSLGKTQFLPSERPIGCQVSAN